MNKVIFEGSCVALVTPFNNDQVDFDALGNLIEAQITGGTSAILVLGTTGEPSTLSQEEKHNIITFAKQKINGRAKLLVGTGGNNTKKVIEDSLYAKQNGADGLLLVTPYYNKCTQNGLIEHYFAVAEAVKFPMIVYNVPGRTGVNIMPETAEKLSHNQYICGIKEASGNIDQLCHLMQVLRDKMAIYSGEDFMNFVFMSMGAKGVISVTANVVPQKVSQVANLCLNGKYKEALEIQNSLYALDKGLFVEVNPIPVKAALEIMGKISGEIRLPLTHIEPQNMEKVKKILQELI